MMIELKLSNMILQFYLVVNPYYLAIISKVFFLESMIKFSYAVNWEVMKTHANSRYGKEKQI